MMIRSNRATRVSFMIILTLFITIIATQSFAANSIVEETWDKEARETPYNEGAIGQQYTISFPAMPADFSPTRAWGTDIYTDDSSIAVAALHAGLITTAGGVVTFEIRPGQDNYLGSTRNGVMSNSYANWPRSFSFVTSSGCRVTPKSLSTDITGVPAAGTAVQFTVNAVSKCGGTIYYRYAYHADYGSDAYNSGAWIIMTPTEFTTSNSISYTFPTTGHYVVVVWTTSSTAAPTPIPLIGTSITIEN